MKLLDKQEVESELFDLFKPVEGFNSFYYGHVRNGKTYAATADILELLERGEIVYANWLIDVEDYDERSIPWIVFTKSLFGKSVFYRYSADNFHYFSPKDVDVKFLSRLVNVHIFIDEGQWLFNSHIRNPDPHARELILHGGHYCRSLNIISQRPINVFKDMRSQIQFWYKCEKKMSWPFLVFQKTCFEDMKGDEPDEEKPSGRPKVYLASRRVLRAYNTHAMRDADAIEEKVRFEAYRLSWGDRALLVGSMLVPKWVKALAKWGGGNAAAPRR